MRKKPQPPQDELEQFEAYGEYSYAYRHAAEDKRRRHKEEPQDEGSHENDDEWSALDAAYPEPLVEQLTPRERAQARKRSITGRLIFALGIVVFGMIILQSAVFRLKTVYVIGNIQKTAQQIAAASGLVKGLNIFAISQDEVREHLSTDHTIIFLGLQKDYPSTIYLYISEREAVASTQWLGLQYTLDSEGIVMSESSSMDMPVNMPAVSGLQITNIHVGQKLEVRNPEQLQAYTEIMSELSQQYYRDQITELNLSDMDNLYLLTANGISVRLGNAMVIRAKIGALRTDMAYLEQLGKTSGILDVSIPEDAKYRPDS